MSRQLGLHHTKTRSRTRAPPLGASLRLGMPERRHCSVGPSRRAIPASAQCLRSAIVVNGAPEINVHHEAD